jgi:hypothetical protein
MSQSVPFGGNLKGLAAKVRMIIKQVSLKRYWYFEQCFCLFVYLLVCVVFNIFIYLLQNSRKVVL